MNDQNFQLRLTSPNEGDENTLTSLRVEMFQDDAWSPFDIHLRSPGFQILVYSVFICQHFYLVVNATEKGLRLREVAASFDLVTTENWDIKRVNGRFSAALRAGTPAPEDIEYIKGRMMACPVSRNLRSEGLMHTELRFQPAGA